jgi:hypothetical protein
MYLLLQPGLPAGIKSKMELAEKPYIPWKYCGKLLFLVDSPVVS